MPARKPSPEIPALTSTMALLQLVAGPEMMAAAMPILRERMALTPEKLAILLERALNPDAIITKGDEATVRGVKGATLAGYKADKFFPEYLGGSQPLPAPRQP